MNNFNKRGLLIVFEGVDRVGKSTQVEMLKNYFIQHLNQNCETINFPDRTSSSGLQLNDVLKNCKTMAVRASHLLFSFNRWEKREYILEKLLSGVNLIVDRYAFSGVVYSICNGGDPEWCRYADQGLPRPDIVFQLDIDIDQIMHRENFGSELYEKEEFQKNIRNHYKIFENYKYWKVINAHNKKEFIHNRITEEIESLFEKYENKISDDASNNYYPYSIGEDLFMSINI